MNLMMGGTYLCILQTSKVQISPSKSRSDMSQFVAGNLPYGTKLHSSLADRFDFDMVRLSHMSWHSFNQVHN